MSLSLSLLVLNMNKKKKKNNKCLRINSEHSKEGRLFDKLFGLVAKQIGCDWRAGRPHRVTYHIFDPNFGIILLQKFFDIRRNGIGVYDKSG